MNRAAGAAPPAEGPGVGERRTRVVALVTLVAMVGEILAGWWFNSMALLADGWHMGTHALAIGLAALAYALARRWQASQRFAFGTWKLEVLAGFTSAIVLMAVAVAMVVASVERLLAPQDIRYVEAMVVAVLGLVVNLACVQILGVGHGHGHGHAHSHAGHGHAHHDLNLRAAYLHVLADAATSALAIVALAAGLWGGWAWLDPAIGLVGAAMVARWSWGLLGDTARPLLDCEMDHPFAAELRQAITTGAPWSQQVELLQLRVWRTGGNQFAAIVSLRSSAPWVSAGVVRQHLARWPQLATLSVEVLP